MRVLKLVGLAFGAMFLTAMVMGSFEGIAHAIYPGLDPAHDDIPTAAILLVLAGNFAGASAGGWVVGRFAGASAMSLSVILGVLFTFGQAINLATIPHPWWFTVLGLCAFLPPYVGVARAVAARRAS